MVRSIVEWRRESCSAFFVSSITGAQALSASSSKGVRRCTLLLFSKARDAAARLICRRSASFSTSLISVTNSSARASADPQGCKGSDLDFLITMLDTREQIVHAVACAISSGIMRRKSLFTHRRIRTTPKFCSFWELCGRNSLHSEI